MKNLMFLVITMLFVVGMANAQTAQQEIIPITVDAGIAALEIGVGELAFAGLKANTCYEAPADPSGATTIINPYFGDEEVSQTATSVTGDPFMQIDVQFTLPHVLPSTGLGTGVVTLSYDGISAAWGNDGEQNNFFNPKGTVTVMDLNADGEVYILLSANPCTPRLMDADTFEGQAIITVQYHQ